MAFKSRIAKQKKKRLAELKQLRKEGKISDRKFKQLREGEGLLPSDFSVRKANDRPSTSETQVIRQIEQQEKNAMAAMEQQNRVEAARQQARENLRPLNQPIKEYRKQQGTYKPTTEERANEIIDQASFRSISRSSIAPNFNRKIQVSIDDNNKESNKFSTSPPNVSLMETKEDKIEKKVQKTIERENRLNRAIDNSYSLLRLRKEKETYSSVKDYVKDIPNEVAKFPFESSRAIITGIGRIPLIVEAAKTKYGRRELGIGVPELSFNVPTVKKRNVNDKTAYELGSKKVTVVKGLKEDFLLYNEVAPVVKESFNPKKPSGLINIALTTLAVKKLGANLAEKRTISKGTNVDLEGFYNPNKQSATFVGEGIFRGKEAKVVVTQEGLTTKTFIRESGKLTKVETTPTTTTTSVLKNGFFEQLDSRPTKPNDLQIFKKVSRQESVNNLIEPKGFQKGTFLTEEKIRQDISGIKGSETQSINYDFTLSDIVKTKVETTPKIVRVSEYPLENGKFMTTYRPTKFNQYPEQVRFVKSLNVQESNLKFGDIVLKDKITIEPIKNNLARVTEVVEPKAYQKGLTVRTGKGSLSIREFEPIKPQRSFGGLLKSKKASSTFSPESLLESNTYYKQRSPLVEINPPNVGLPPINTPLSNPPILINFNTTKRKERSYNNTSSKFKFYFKDAFTSKYNSNDFSTNVNNAILQKQNTYVDVIRSPDTKTDAFIKKSNLNVSQTSTNFSPKFDLNFKPNTPNLKIKNPIIPPINIDLPQQNKKKSSSKKSKGVKQKTKFTPSFTKGILNLNLKRGKDSDLFSGLELR